MIAMTAVLVSGCEEGAHSRGKRWHRKFVGAKPKVADVVGTYVLSDQTVIPGGVSALGGRECVLDVRADGSFSITNYPECAGADSSKLKQYATFYNDTGTWELAVVGTSYGYTQNAKDCWGLGLHGSKHRGRLGAPAFMGPEPPYELLEILGDPDSNDTLRFTRKE